MNTNQFHERILPRNAFSVSELNRQIKQILEREMPFVWVSGEISNLHTPSSGHIYFTLKDSQSQLNAVIFRGQAQRLKFALEIGLAVLGVGRLSVYEPRGTYQIIFEHLEPRGIGDLQLAFEQLKHKLAAEGLFDANHKKALPALPTKIHVITSPSGAVIHDIIKIVHRRFENMPITIIPTAVQGTRAPAEIIAAIQHFDRQPHAELAIIARGGGSIEDLQAFNDESVARAIYHARHPIVSAVGHETDFTIADFVSDLRAPTPSAAAEQVVPDKSDLLNHIHARTTQMCQAIQADLHFQRQYLSDRHARLKSPRRKVIDGRLHLDDRCQRLVAGLRRTIHDQRRELDMIFSRLVQNPWLSKIEKAQQIIEQLNSKLMFNIENIIHDKQWSARNMTSRLETLSPSAVLKRGYSITRTWPQYEVVTGSRQVAPDDRVEIILAAGRLQCRVEGKEENGEIEKF